VRLKYYLTATFLMLAPLAVFIGCNKANAPVGIATASNIKITVPLTNPNGKVLNVNGDVLYYLAGTGAPVTGTAGTVTASSGFSFSFNVVASASAPFNYVAVEIRDSVSHVPVAIGATSFSAATVPVTLGPMNKSVYQVNPLGAGQVLNFQSDSIVGMGPTPTPGVASVADVYCKTTSTGFELDNPSLTTSTIAYMGNGDFLKFLQLPASSAFQVTSTASKALSTTPTDVAPGDVYCVKLLGGGYAWLQVTSVTTSGPSFVFRVNTTQTYCGYEPSTADGILIASSFTATPTATSSGLSYSAAATYKYTGAGNPYDVAVLGPANSAATVVLVPDITGSVYAFSGGVSYQIINPTTAPFTGSTPIGLNLDSSGVTLYVADPGTWMVNQFHPNSTFTSAWTWIGCVGNGTVITPPDTVAQANNGALLKPRYVSFDSSGNLFITDTGTAGLAGVMEYLGPSIPVVATTNVAYWNGSLSSAPASNGIGQIANAGTTVIVADSDNNAIELYSSTGSLYRSLNSDNNSGGAVTFSHPQGVAYSAAENLLYVSDTGHNRIVKISPSGVFDSIIGSTILNGPTGLKLDSAVPANLYVADTGNGRVLQFQP